MRDVLRIATLLFRSLGLVVLVLAALRWIFFFSYRSSFPVLQADDALSITTQGLRFDAMTIVVANAPLILLTLFLLPWYNRSWLRWVLSLLFVLANVVLLGLVCIDLPYYGFNGKRLSSDLTGQASAGLRELPAMALNYWWATLLFVIATMLVWRWASEFRRQTASGPATVRALPLLLVVAGIFALISRGGWQYQGLSPAHASDHVGPAWAPLVTNSAFTFSYSLTEPALRQRDWFTPSELDRIMPLRYAIHGDSTSQRPNVVLLIVESLGREYLGSLNNTRGYMPFIDSLCGHSLVMTNAYANAERSNKSMCAILAGIPSFTDDAFMNTAYGSNSVEGLGTRMKTLGYNTSFFHGGINGEYKFDSFTRACGFDRYFGKDEFGDDRFYDGHWGIYDEEFLVWSGDRINELPQPFCAALFTLSSHDPFPVPERYKGKFPTGGQEIHESLGYADMAVRRFFDGIKNEAWFTNSIFVITGDHTFQYNDHPAWYRNPAGRFSVPIIFYAPDGRFNGMDDRVAQHLDILPSILDLAGYSGTVNTFGQSVFQRDRPDRAVIQLGGQYRLIENDRMLLFDGERAIGLFDYLSDTLCTNDLRMLEPERTDAMMRDVKAMIQRHADVLLHNTMVAR